MPHIVASQSVWSFEANSDILFLIVEHLLRSWSSTNEASREGVDEPTIVVGLHSPLRIYCKKQLFFRFCFRIGTLIGPPYYALDILPTTPRSFRRERIAIVAFSSSPYSPSAQTGRSWTMKLCGNSSLLVAFSSFSSGYAVPIGKSCSSARTPR